jgi:hypothetical protein
VHPGHFSRNTLRDGVLEFASNVGEVFGVESMLGAVTIVSFGAEGGSTGSLALVVVTAEVLVDATSFILALDLVGGMYLEVWYLGFRKAEWSRVCPVPSQREWTRNLAGSCSGATAVALTATKSDGFRRHRVNGQGARDV